MKRWIPMFVVGALLFSVAAFAQGEVEIILNGETTSVASGTTLADLVRNLGRDADDVDVTYNGNAVRGRGLDTTVSAGDSVSIVEADHESRYGFGIGVGLVNLDEEAIDDDVETYFTAHLRIAFGDTRAHHHSSGRRTLRGYLEPEVGIWESDFASDTLIGINIIGSIPFNAVDFFVGAGAALHMLETDPRVIDGVTIPGTDDDAFGVNAQFGVDVHLSETTTVFGTGRFDIIDDSSDSLEAKVYLGLRFAF